MLNLLLNKASQAHDSNKTVDVAINQHNSGMSANHAPIRPDGKPV